MITQHPDFIDDPDRAPIGVFDSGVGGLSVYLHLKAVMPYERFIYYADTANVPYGGKSSDEILLLTLQAVARLCKRGCKLIVIACNSASAHALKVLRERCTVPIVGLVPAVKPACALTKTGHVAVLATQATLVGHLLSDVVEQVAMPAGITVHRHFEPSLVPWVESGMPVGSRVATLLTHQTQIWADQGVDVIVLGCTHYPFFKNFLQQYIDEHALDMHLIDSGIAVAERVKSLIQLYNIASQNVSDSDTPLQVYATCVDTTLLSTISRLVGEQAVALIDWMAE